MLSLFFFKRNPGIIAQKRYLNREELKKLDRIEKNVRIRKCDSNVTKIKDLLKKSEKQESSEKISNSENVLAAEIRKLPNATHPRIFAYNDQAKEFFINERSESLFRAEEFSKLAKQNHLFQMEHLTNLTGHKSYYLFGTLAEMELTLTEYSLSYLKKRHFKLISVPDILPDFVIEGCGMLLDRSRSQVYRLDSGLCLSGTSEMAMGNYFANILLKRKYLPLKMAALSRCYRAETSGLLEEKSIFRVHQFTKVEMFAVCADNDSEGVLSFFRNTQIDLFKKLKLHIKLLEMPPSELGLAAYHKYDIEAWMPGKRMWGEISSCSNCTDYQGKRLNMRYRNRRNVSRFAHTVNGTAGAVPRLLISILESNQLFNGTILIPPALQNRMKRKLIDREIKIPQVRLVKQIKNNQIM